MKAIKPLIYDYQQLEKHAQKPKNLWLWGWSSSDRWGYSPGEVDLLLLRIKFEIGKILPNYPLSLSAEEYEYKCLNMLSDSGKDAKRTLRSKIYYDLFMFLDAKSGSDSIDYFIECVNLTASYANRRQFKMRVNSLVEGLKRLENFQAYSKCEDWIKQHYGEEFFLNLGDL